MKANTKLEPRRSAELDRHVPSENHDAAQVPQVDIYENTDSYVLLADMPGVSRDGLEILLERNELTIVGRRAKSPQASPQYRESVNGDYRRVFVLDPEIDTAKITAQLENGVLTLTLAKAEDVKPRKITVTG